MEATSNLPAIERHRQSRMSIVLILALLFQVVVPLLPSAEHTYAAEREASALLSGKPNVATVGHDYVYQFVNHDPLLRPVVLAGGALPPGLALAADGSLSGTPSRAGRYSFALALRDTSSSSVARNISMLVANPPRPAMTQAMLSASSYPNIALNKTASVDASCAANETGAQAIDGNTITTKWCSPVDTNSFLQIDLGASATIDEFDITHAGSEDIDYNTRDFTISVSNDGSQWSPVVTVTGNTATITSHPIAAANARYVRLDVQKGDAYAAGLEPWRYNTRIFEFEVHGYYPPAATATPIATSMPTATATPSATCGSNLALNHTASASSEEFARYAASYAVNGINLRIESGVDDRWSSNTSNSTEWWQIDLGAITTWNKLVVSWEAGATNYDIQQSDDGTTWTNVLSGLNSPNYESRTLTTSPVTSRYVRVLGHTPANAPNYSLYEFEVYNCVSATPTPTTASTPTATPTSVASTPTATSVVSTPTATSAAGTPTATPVTPASYQDVGSLRVWADSFSPNGAGFTASGNVGIGSVSANARYFRVGDASWTSTSFIQASGALAFESGTAIGSGTFTIDTSTGGVAWAANNSVAISKLGNSNIPVSATIVMNAFQPGITVNAQASLAALPENSGKTLAVSYGLDGSGVVTPGAAAALALTFAGGTLSANVAATQAGLSAPSASLLVGGLTIAFPTLLIDGNGSNKLTFGDGSFALANIDLGGGALVLQNLSATVSVANNAYTLPLVGKLGINRLPEMTAFTVQLNTLSIGQNALIGALPTMSVKLAGLTLALSGGNIQSSGGSYKVGFSGAEWTIPAAFGTSTIALQNVALTTTAPYLSVDGGSGKVSTTKVFTLGGSTNTSTQVTFDQISGTISYLNGSFSSSLNSRVVFKLGKSGEGATATGVRLTIAAGSVNGTIASLTLRVASLNLVATSLAFKDGQFSTASAKLSLPDKWKASALTLSGITINKDGLQIGGAGVSFPIPDVSLGANGVLKLTKMSGSLSADLDGNYAIGINTTLTIQKVQSSGGTNGVTVAGKLTIKNGRVSGTLSSLAFKLSGVEFAATNVSFVDDKLSAASVKITLPVKGSSASATAYGLEIGGDAGFRLQGAKVSLPDFKIGTVGVRKATIEFKSENGEYTVSGSAKFEFTKFSVDGSFKIGYSSNNSVSVKSIRLAFQGSIPTTAIALGTTGFYIVRVAGSFNLDDGSATISLSLGASSALRVGSVSLLDIDGTMTLQIKPNFELRTNATAKVVGIQVASVDMRITSTSFSLKGNLRVSVIQASIEVTFGKDARGEFTFYGALKADVSVPRGYFLGERCVNTYFFGRACTPAIPGSDTRVGSASLEGGKFRRGNDTIWGARGAVRVIGYDLNVWAKFGPNGTDYGLGGKLKDYQPVRPAASSRTRAIAGRDLYTVGFSNPVGYLMVVELITTTHRLAPQNVLISSPAGASFRSAMVYETADKTMRLYRVDPATPSQSVGQWTLQTQTNNVIFVQGADAPPHIDSFTACLNAATCFANDQKVTLDNGQTLDMNWSTSAFTPSMALDVYAQSATGMRYPIAHQETTSAKTLSGSKSWTLGLPSGTYTISLELQSDIFAPVVAGRGVVTINDTTAPAAPANLQAQVDVDMSAELSWDGSAAPTDIAGYQVGVDGSAPIAVDGAFASYIVAGLEAGQQHTVSVAAYDLSGNIGPAATATITTPTTGVTAQWPHRDSADSMVDQVGVSFNKPITLRSFQVFAADNSEMAGTSDALIENPTVDQTITLGATFTPAAGTLQPGTYTARVDAVDAETGVAVLYSWRFEVIRGTYLLYMPIVSIPAAAAQRARSNR